jgi:hypothetical protein
VKFFQPISHTFTGVACGGLTRAELANNRLAKGFGGSNIEGCALVSITPGVCENDRLYLFRGFILPPHKPCDVVTAGNLNDRFNRLKE